MCSRCLWTKGAPVVLPSPGLQVLAACGPGLVHTIGIILRDPINASLGLFGEDERAVASYAWLYDLSPGESRALLWSHESVRVPLGALGLSPDESQALL